MSDASEDPRGGLSKQAKIGYIRTIVLVGFVAAVFYHYVMGAYLGLGYPHNTFLFKPWDRFNDFFSVLLSCQNLDPQSPEHYMGGYFPLAYVVGFLLSLIRPWQLIFGVVVTVFVALVVWGNARFGWDRRVPVLDNLTNVVVLSFMGYPFLYALDRGNFDILMFMLLAAFLLLYRRGSLYLCLLPLAVSIAMKGYTAVFLLLLISDKRYREALYASWLALLLCVGSLALFQGGLLVSYGKWLASMDTAVSSGFFQSWAFFLHFNSCLFTMLWAILCPMGIDLTASAMPLKIYTIGAALYLVLAAVYMLSSRLDFRQKVSLLVLLMILLPPTTGDYRLVMLFIPLWGFLSAKTQTPYDTWTAILFGTVLIPKAYWLISQDANIAMIINPALMLGMLVLIVLSARNAQVSASAATESGTHQTHVS